MIKVGLDLYTEDKQDLRRMFNLFRRLMAFHRWHFR